MENICRWGFLSTAEIGQKNWHAISNAGNATVTAVGSRTVERSQQFIDHCQSHVPLNNPVAAVGSYEQLIERDDVDAVYIPLPTGMRKEWVIKAANAGKHVLCEKPCAINGDDLHEMIEACKANQVQFMDGVMYMHTDRLASMKTALNESIGDLRRITTQFSFNGPEEFRQSNIRTDSNLEPHGCLGDLGWYTIRFILWAMDYEMPVSVCGRILSQLHREGSPEPVPMQFSAEMLFSNGVSANFYNSFETNHQQWGVICGSQGFLQVRDFVLPFLGNQLSYSVTAADFVVDGCDFVMEDHTKRYDVPEYSNNAPSAAETKLFRTFSGLVQSGQVDQHWPQISLNTQRVLDACFESAKSNSKMLELNSEMSVG